MDIFKQTNKKIRKNIDENKLNTRRIQENFPQVERKVDYIVYNYPYKMEFPLSDHPHGVKMSLAIKPPENCFQCVLGPSPIHVEASGYGGVGPEDGNSYAVNYTLTSNVGGFTLDPAGGIIVPQDGVYNCSVTGSISGVTVTGAAAAIATVKRNGVILAQKVYSVSNGRLNPPLAYINIDVNMYGLCVPCRAGDTIGAWFAAGGIAFYNGSISSTVTLVGLG